MELRPPETESTVRPSPPMPLAYQPRADALPPPFDSWAAVRQVVFAFGVACLAGGIASTWGYEYGWADNGILWIAFGAWLVALVVPWPGRFGRKRTARP